jgi:hypothetical protein
MQAQTDAAEAANLAGVTTQIQQIGHNKYGPCYAVELVWHAQCRGALYRLKATQDGEAQEMVAMWRMLVEAV